MMEHSFRIRSYGLQELAGLYSPEVGVDAAIRRLNTWINERPALREELLREGWFKGKRVLPPRVVKVLVTHLGEP